MEPKAYKLLGNNPVRWRSGAGNSWNRDDIRERAFSLSPFLRGEGRGEGPLSAVEIVERPVPPHPEFAHANSDLSPQAGRGEEEAPREYEMMRTE
ncbi:hypothetical protein CVM73_38215 [Bradyrhizobium forestalis]|uniref:Uncharacterized protein n=1 Tax=Bradyrhizobium forestalis TaxID=1419263 RepID=A0A2M8QWZ7_9BRAD|nr:hypothetical protein CVM73_38215 [Bradyrhizobium forestalis]